MSKNPMDVLENKELLQFFHSHKTEIACMEKPRTFLTQLRDHDLVPEDRYQKMKRMKGKETLKDALYDFLDWLETKRPELIREFWRAAFKEITMNHYPTLRRLYCSLMDVEMTDGGSWKELSGNGEEEESSTIPGKRKKQEPPCVDTPGGRRKSRKVHPFSPLNKGEKGDIWTWPIYKVQLPVSCGEQDGVLDRNRMAEGRKCIVVNRRWFSPNEFEKFAGKQSNKNWKMSIRCMGTPLGTLIQEGHLKWTRSRDQPAKARRLLFMANCVITDDEDEDSSEETDSSDQPSTSGDQRSSRSTEAELMEEAEQEPEVHPDVFKVTCGAMFGALHKKRFASGTCGKCIRTETCWVTPVEFVEEALGPTDTAWRRDIQWEGKPLSALIQSEILKIHFLNCNCVRCKPANADDLESQKNDDECWACRSGEDTLVMCDECPRSFHQKCHLPQMEDGLLGDGGQWLCTLCVFKTNRNFCDWSEQSREKAASRHTSQHMLECQYLLLRLFAADASTPNPGSSELRMRLGLVADQLQQQLYQTVGEFVSDVELLFTDCTPNNQAAAAVAVGDGLKEMFDEDFKNVFYIA